MSPGPRIAIRERDLLLGPEIGFHLDLLASANPDLSIVLDIYDLDNPVHPEGHVGWWKFNAVQLEGDASARIVTGRNIAVEISGAQLADHWVNPLPPAARHLVVNAVLRSNATNAIVDVDRIPAMASATELAELRNRFSRDWQSPRYAPAPFVPSRGQTVHLATPEVFLRDAVGNLCLDLYRMLKQSGIPVRLHASNADLGLSDIVEPLKALPDLVSEDDHLLYFCTTFDPLLERLAAVGCRKSAYFHGITDPARLRVFDPELSVVASRARAALPLLARFDQLAANSRTNAEHLAAALGRPAALIQVIPPQLVANVSPQAKPGQRDASLLTVCQLNPHKKVEDVLRLFAAYRSHIPGAVCRIVGRPRHRAYRDYLTWVETQELGLPEGAVHWYGSIDDAALAELYRTSGIYVSMSEDEGFCLPVVEAMRHGLPVFAYAISAVIETLGGAGVTFGDKDFAYLAGTLVALRDDDALRQSVVAAQAERALELGRTMTGRSFFDLLRPLPVASPSGA